LDLEFLEYEKEIDDYPYSVSLKPVAETVYYSNMLSLDFDGTVYSTEEGYPENIDIINDIVLPSYLNPELEDFDLSLSQYVL